MENEIKLNGTVLAENNAAGTEEDPILSLIRAKYMDSDGKVHLAFLQTLLSSVVDKDGKRLDRTIEELQEAVGIGGGTVTELINTEIDKKVGDLANLETDAKDLIVSAINEINQGLNKKLQYVPVPVDITQNPETYQTGYIYVIEGDVSTENGHPYTAGWTHITYFVFGEENEENSYKNIVGIDYRGRIFNKSQGQNIWSDWLKIATIADLSSKPDKLYTIYNKNIITNDILTGSAFTNKSWVGIAHNLENAPVSGWVNYLCLDAAATGSDLNRMLAMEANSKSHLYFTAGNKASDWVRVLDIRDLDNLSNPNLAYNPDFQIKQRNMGSFTTSNDTPNGAYFPDRWICNRDFSDNGLTYTIKEDGLHCKFDIPAGSYGHICQTIDIKDAIPLSGKTVTFSANCSVSGGEGHGGIRLLVVYEGTYTHVKLISRVYFDDLKEGLHKMTVTLPAITDTLMFAIHTSHDTAGGEVVINWVKIEEGTESTRFVHPDYGLELTRCKRFWQKIGGWWKYMAIGFVSKADKVAKFPLILESPMRVVPTLIIQNKERIKAIGSNINVDIIDLEGFQNASENYYNISFSLPEGTVVETLRDFVALYFGENVELQFDAEYY